MIKQNKTGPFRFLTDFFLAWRAFHLTQRRLYTVSYALQKAQAQNKLDFSPKNLDALNRKRMFLQQEIARVSSKSKACCVCMGRCCSGDHNLFTAVDYNLRRCSNKPLTSYGFIPKENELLSNMTSFRKQLRYLLKSSRLSDSTFNVKQRCAHLTEKGCSLAIQDRPIICLIFTCKEFRDGLSYNELIELANLTIEMQTIQNKLIDLLAGKPRFMTLLKNAVCI
jgi:hypothetical protein